jgi:hypothetical protein
MRILCTIALFVMCTFGMSPVESRLDQQMRAWQRRLRLDDWTLRVQVVRQQELDRNTWGNAEWDPVKKTGTIKVLDPQDYNLKGAELRQDMECTIVHELVHIRIAPLDANDYEIREEIVNSIMNGLLNRPCPN